MEWVCLCGVTISFLYAYMEKEAQQLPAAQKSTALLSLLDDFAILNTVRGKDFKQAKSEFAGLQKNYELLRRQKKVPPCCNDDLFATKMEAFSEEIKGVVDGVSESLNAVEEYYKRFITKYGPISGVA